MSSGPRYCLGIGLVVWGNRRSGGPDIVPVHLGVFLYVSEGFA